MSANTRGAAAQKTRAAVALAKRNTDEAGDPRALLLVPPPPMLLLGSPPLPSPAADEGGGAEGGYITAYHCSPGTREAERDGRQQR